MAVENIVANYSFAIFPAFLGELRG